MKRRSGLALKLFFSFTLVLSFGFACFSVRPVMAAPAWYNSSWTKRVVLSIDNSQIASTLTDFPMYVDLGTLPDDFWSNVKSGGGDIVLTDEAGTKLNRELVSINSSAKTGELWVKVPSVSSTAVTNIYMYYGNPAGSESNSTATWNSNYVGVYHMDEQTYNDTFTGTTIDTNKWNNYWGTPTQNDKLILNTGTGNWDSDGMQAKSLTFYSDFDVQFDFDATTWTSPATAAFDLGLRVYTNDASHFYGVNYNRTASNIYYTNYQNETGAAWGSTSTAAKSGKLRLTRVGSTIHSYYWNGSIWVEIGSGYTGTYSGQPFGIVRLYVSNQTTGKATPDTYVDNFTINSGEPMQDSTGNTIRGVNHGAEYSGSGKFSGTEYFAGTSDDILLTDALYSNNFTLQAWVKPDAAALTSGVTNGIVSKRSGADLEWILKLGSGCPQFAGWDSSANVLFDTDATSIPAATWTRIDGRFNGTSSNIIVNGSVIATTNSISNTLKNTTAKIIIGTDRAEQATEYFHGSIDEVRLVNTALSNAWIAAEYANQNSPAAFYLTPAYENVNNSHITGIGSGLSIARADSSVDVYTGGVGANSSATTLRVSDSQGIILTDVMTNMTSDRDWSTVNGQTSLALGKSVISGMASAPGAAATHTLYIPIPTTIYSSRVVICPNATVFSDVESSCSGALLFTEGQTQSGITVTRSQINGINYWVAAGVTGTGGIALADHVNLSDGMDRSKVSTAANHEIELGTVNGLTTAADTLIISFDPEGHDFDLSTLTVSDIDLDTDSKSFTLAGTPGVNVWGVVISTANDTITFTAPSSGTDYIGPAAKITVKIGNNAAGGTNQIINPANSGSYKITGLITNAQGTEEAGMSVAIVDSDQVNITGFVNTFINFDIDTGTTDTDCAYNSCLNHSGGTAAANYVVDLGELNSTWVNKSEDASVMHSDGNNGVINSIYFDLTTNAYNGAVLYVKSANGGLQGPGTNLIPSVSDGSNIRANDGAYGFQLTDTGSGNGTIVRNLNCTTATAYCGLSTTQKEVFNTNSKPLDNGRLRMDLAAAASYVNNPGNYTDILTFLVVPLY